MFLCADYEALLAGFRYNRNKRASSSEPALAGKNERRRIFSTAPLKLVFLPIRNIRFCFGGGQPLLKRGREFLLA